MVVSTIWRFLVWEINLKSVRSVPRKSVSYIEVSALKIFNCNYVRCTQVKYAKGNSGGVSFCWIGIQYAMLYSHKYTPPHCFLLQFCRGWDGQFRKKINTFFSSSYKLAIMLLWKTNFKEESLFKNNIKECLQKHSWCRIILDYKIDTIFHFNENEAIP